MFIWSLIWFALRVGGRSLARKLGACALVLRFHLSLSLSPISSRLPPQFKCKITKARQCWREQDRETLYNEPAICEIFYTKSCVIDWRDFLKIYFESYLFINYITIFSSSISLYQFYKYFFLRTASIRRLQIINIANFNLVYSYQFLKFLYSYIYRMCSPGIEQILVLSRPVNNIIQIPVLLVLFKYYRNFWYDYTSEIFWI